MSKFVKLAKWREQKDILDQAYHYATEKIEELENELHIAGEQIRSRDHEIRTLNAIVSELLAANRRSQSEGAIGTTDDGSTTSKRQGRFRVLGFSKS